MNVTLIVAILSAIGELIKLAVSILGNKGGAEGEADVSPADKVQAALDKAKADVKKACEKDGCEPKDGSDDESASDEDSE